MTHRERTPFLLLIPLLVASMGCSENASENAVSAGSLGAGSASMPAMETKADTVAMAVYNAYGGPAAWTALPYLRFDFATGSESDRAVHGSHFWNRMTGDYRVEMPAGEDSTYVALFNVNTREGDVFLNGSEVEEEREAELLESAYRRFINDTYWMLMPVKLFDPGVHREYVPDSSDVEHDVLRLSFGEVGLTPGDQYWVYVDRETGLVDQWAFRLQNHPPDHVPQKITWAGHTTFDTPQGDIVISQEKPRDGSVLFTDNVAVPVEPPAGVFTDPEPML